MISMRSTCGRLMAARSVWPSVAEPMRTPSISTSVLVAPLPRIRMPALCPGPPVARELDAALAAQQVFQRIGAAGADAVVIDHHHVGHHAVQRSGCARADHLHRAARVGLGLRPGRRSGLKEGKAKQQPRGPRRMRRRQDDLRCRTPRAGRVQDKAAWRESATRARRAQRWHVPAPPTATPATRASGRYPGLRVPVRAHDAPTEANGAFPGESPSGCVAVRTSPTVAGAAPEWSRGECPPTHRLPV